MLSSSEINLGLIGQKLSHSFSKRYFEEKYGIATYSLIELASLTDLHGAIERLHLDGFNVTIPYKREIMAMLDEIDPVAREIGAVNTVVVRGLKGYNTDAPAFLETLRPLLTNRHRHAVILGTGGAALAVAWALGKLGIEYRTVSRLPIAHPGSISYDEAHDLMAHESYNIIINATPVGMYPNTDATPWRWPELLNASHICYDLVYNPSPTLFLRQAASQGATVIDGLGMLHRQADIAYKIWGNELQ